MTIDERFTDLADVISERMGRWQVSAISLVLVVAWTLYCAVTQGASWWYSTVYNFPLSLIMTVAELFIGFLIAAAANRVERHNRQLLEAHARLQEQGEKMLENNNALLQRIDALLEGKSKTP